MVAPIGFSRAKLTRSDGDTLDGVQVVVRAGRIRVTQGRELLIDREVQSVSKTGRRQVTIAFDDGTTWVAERAKGRCCGG